MLSLELNKAAGTLRVTHGTLPVPLHVTLVDGSVPEYTYVCSPSPPEFRPFRDDVLVDRLDPESKVGAIDLPNQVQRPRNEGIVRSIGPLVTDLAVGDRVLFGLHAGNTIPGLPSSTLLLKACEILAVAT